MKRMVLVIGICAFLSTVSGAYAAPFTWSGGASGANSTVWQYTAGSSPYDNWNNSGFPGDFPGKNGSSDKVQINDDPNSAQPVFSSSSGTRTVASITLDADANAIAVSLEVSGGSLTTNGMVKLVGRGEGVGDATATMKVSGGTFAPNNFNIDGGATTPRRAVLEFGVSVTVGGKTGTDTSVDGFVDFDLTATGVVFDAKEMAMVDSDTDLQVTGSGNTTTKLRYDSFALNGGTVMFVGPLTVEVN